MNSDQLPEPYVWEPDPANDMLTTPDRPKDVEKANMGSYVEPEKTIGAVVPPVEVEQPKKAKP